MMQTHDALTRRPVQVWAYIISWTDREDDARRIAARVVQHVDRLTVIYSNAAGTTATGAGEWEQVSDEYYYGRKFEASLKGFGGDVMLQIQADASSADWGSLIGRCRSAFNARPSLGVWSPEVDFTSWPLALTNILTEGDGSHQVTLTDSVVWALSSDVCNRLRSFNYDRNNHGWGIDIAAALFSHNRGLDILVDPSVPVDHPASTAYDGTQASAEMLSFFSGLSPCERRTLALLDEHHRLRRQAASSMSDAQKADRPHGSRSFLRRLRSVVRGNTS